MSGQPLLPLNGLISLFLFHLCCPEETVHFFFVDIFDVSPPKRLHEPRLERIFNSKNVNKMIKRAFEPVVFRYVL